MEKGETYYYQPTPDAPAKEGNAMAEKIIIIIKDIDQNDHKRTSRE